MIDLSENFCREDETNQLSMLQNCSHAHVHKEFATMPQATALEFQRRFIDLQHQAQREPVEITRHGRREFVPMSADHYDWLVAAAKRTHRTSETPDVVFEAITRAEMDPTHAALDEHLN
jgi:prevent-host-death family protein